VRNLLRQRLRDETAANKGENLPGGGRKTRCGGWGGGGGAKKQGLRGRIQDQGSKKESIFHPAGILERGEAASRGSGETLATKLGTHPTSRISPEKKGINTADGRE